MLADLISFDSRSLIGVLFWGNVATGFIVYMYHLFSSYTPNHSVFRGMTIVRFLSALGFLFMFFRGSIPDIFSVNICNTLLFLCFTLEARLILELANGCGKKLDAALLAIFVVDIFVFNLLEFLYRDASLRITAASAIIFSIYLLPTIKLMISKTASKFKKSIGIFYLLLLFALIARSVGSLLDGNVSIHTNNYYQTLMFICLILLMITNTVIYLLFMKEQNDKLIEQMATTDNLTSVLNRHSFFIQGRKVFEEHKASKAGLALLFFDIDRFKNANDEYGHQFGDEVLIRFSEIIKHSIRPSDLCCRYGGEEFIVLLANVNTSISKSIATRIMHEFEKYTFESNPDFKITTSVGNISGIPKPDELLEDYIRMGDEALYHAKKDGRNRLATYGEYTEAPVSLD